MAMISGSLGILASSGAYKGNGLYFGMYKPSGGSVPEVAVTPYAQILSAPLMLRYSLGLTSVADTIDYDVRNAIDAGMRTRDIFTGNKDTQEVTTGGMSETTLAGIVQNLPIKEIME